MSSSRFEGRYSDPGQDIGSDPQLIVNPGASQAVQERCEWLREHLKEICFLIRQVPGWSDISFGGPVIRVVEPTEMSGIESAPVVHGPSRSSEGRWLKNVIYQVVTNSDPNSDPNYLPYWYHFEADPPEILFSSSALASPGEYWDFFILSLAFTEHALGAKYPTYLQELSDLSKRLKRVVSESGVDLPEVTELTKRVKARFIWWWVCSEEIYFNYIHALVYDYLAGKHSLFRKKFASTLMGPIIEYALTTVGWAQVWHGIQHDAELKLISRIRAYIQVLLKPNIENIALFFRYPGLVEVVGTNADRVVIKVSDGEDLPRLRSALVSYFDWRGHQDKKAPEDGKPHVFFELEGGEVVQFSCG